MAWGYCCWILQKLQESVSKSVKSVSPILRSEPCFSTLHLSSKHRKVESGAWVVLALAINTHTTIIKSIKVAQLDIIISYYPLLPSVCVKQPAPPWFSQQRGGSRVPPHLANAQKAFLKSISLTLLNFDGYVHAGELTHDYHSTHDSGYFPPKCGEWTSFYLSDGAKVSAM